MTKPIRIKELTLGEGIPKICVPLTAATREGLCREAGDAAAAGADLVEWRADFYEGLDAPGGLAEALSAISAVLGRIPLLFTIRTRAEGGNRELALRDYVNCNLAAAESGKTDLIDVEVLGQEAVKWGLVEKLRERGVRVIGSSHDFQKTGSREGLLQRFMAMEASKADVLKIAVMPQTFSDVAALMDATSWMRERTEKPLISMSMGSAGVISRIAGESFGSCLTFGTVGAASAPGQVPIEDLRLLMETFHRQLAACS